MLAFSGAAYLYLTPHKFIMKDVLISFQEEKMDLGDDTSNSSRLSLDIANLPLTPFGMSQKGCYHKRQLVGSPGECDGVVWMFSQGITLTLRSRG